MIGRAFIVGNGIASLTCAKLLADRGWEVELQPVSRPGPPILVLNEITLLLLDDIWGPALVDDGYLLRERRVRWGEDAQEVVVPTTNVVVERALLQRRLEDRCAFIHQRLTGRADWVLDGAGRPGRHDTERGRPAVRHSFGERWVIQTEVTLGGPPHASLASPAPHASEIETVADGWVHLAPLSLDRAVLQCMIAEPPSNTLAKVSDMVAATIAIRSRIAEIDDAAAVLSASPRLTLPINGEGWLRVGDAAAGADPVSGSGSAWALRGAILAAAVLDAVARGERPDDCLSHYEARVVRAVEDHVERCLALYRSAFRTPGWSAEIGRMDDGLRALRRLRTPRLDDELRYRLTGLRLEPMPFEPV